MNVIKFDKKYAIKDWTGKYPFSKYVMGYSFPSDTPDLLFNSKDEAELHLKKYLKDKYDELASMYTIHSINQPKVNWCTCDEFNGNDKNCHYHGSNKRN